MHHALVRFRQWSVMTNSRSTELQGADCGLSQSPTGEVQGRDRQSTESSQQAKVCKQEMRGRQSSSTATGVNKVQQAIRSKTSREMLENFVERPL